MNGRNGTLPKTNHPERRFHLPTIDFQGQAVSSGRVGIMITKIDFLCKFHRDHNAAGGHLPACDLVTMGRFVLLEAVGFHHDFCRVGG